MLKQIMVRSPNDRRKTLPILPLEERRSAYTPKSVEASLEKLYGHLGRVLLSLLLG